MDMQEVTPYIHLLMQNSKWWQQYKCLLSQEMAILKPYYCMQVVLSNFMFDIIDIYDFKFLG